MATPSETTRHHALAVTAGNNAREEVDADFDFLSQQPGYKRYSVSVLMVFRICIVLVLFILFVLLIVDLSRRNGDDDADGNGNGKEWLEDTSCFYAIGGGDTKDGGSLNQTKIMSEPCVEAFREYFKQGGLYWKETEEAIDDAREDVLNMKGGYERMVILDIDETSLTNVPLSLEMDFNATHKQREEWYEAGKAPAIEATLDFYKELRTEGFSVAFVTGRNETLRKSTKRNLANVGYGGRCDGEPADGDICYYKLVMRDRDDFRDAVIYKGDARRNLTEKRFNIVASVGDQWSDLIGESRPPVIIKMPNPFYYLP